MQTDLIGLYVRHFSTQVIAKVVAVTFQDRDWFLLVRATRTEFGKEVERLLSWDIDKVEVVHTKRMSTSALTYAATPEETPASFSTVTFTDFGPRYNETKTCGHVTPKAICFQAKGHQGDCGLPPEDKLMSSVFSVGGLVSLVHELKHADRLREKGWQYTEEYIQDLLRRHSL